MAVIRFARHGHRYSSSFLLPSGSFLLRASHTSAKFVHLVFGNRTQQDSFIRTLFTTQYACIYYYIIRRYVLNYNIIIATALILFIRAKKSVIVSAKYGGYQTLAPNLLCILLQAGYLKKIVNGFS